MNERMYHVVAVRETHGSSVYPKGHKTRMTASPVTHAEGCTFLSKMVPYKHIRFLLEEVA